MMAVAMRTCRTETALSLPCGLGLCLVPLAVRPAPMPSPLYVRTLPYLTYIL